MKSCLLALPNVAHKSGIWWHIIIATLYREEPCFSLLGGVPPVEGYCSHLNTVSRAYCSHLNMVRGAYCSHLNSVGVAGQQRRES